MSVECGSMQFCICNFVQTRKYMYVYISDIFYHVNYLSTCQCLGFYLNIVCLYRFRISKLNSENVLLIVWYTCSNIKQPNNQTSKQRIQYYNCYFNVELYQHLQLFYILLFVKFCEICIWCIRTLYSKKNTDNY